MSKAKQTLAFVIGAALSVWCVANAYSALDVTSWFELIGGYAFGIFPFAVALLLISLYSHKNMRGAARNAALSGVLVSALALVVPLLQLMYIVLF